ncbi:MAG: AGE family epimerase/isomerase [Sphaerochaetaceae bacterium]
MIRTEFEQQLTQTIAPFYQRLKDDEYGGYYGRVDHTLALYRKTTKNMVQNSRILWFFSQMAKRYAKDNYEVYALHALDFLLSHGLDSKAQGVFWSLSYAGEVEDGAKNTFCQAYAILALVGYYEAFGNERSLDLAKRLQLFIEEHLADNWGYTETMGNIGSIKTLPTLLHLLEAYTALYKNVKDEQTRKYLEKNLDIWKKKILRGKADHLALQFTCHMEPLDGPISFGHELEATYLLDQAYQALGLPCPTLTEVLARSALRDGLIDGHLCYRSTDRRAVHWVQCEGIMGFFHAYRKTGDPQFLQACETIWEYTKSHLIDQRNGGEWLYDDTDHNKDIVSPWKGPYNNGRLCLTMEANL